MTANSYLLNARLRVSLNALRKAAMIKSSRTSPEQRRSAISVNRQRLFTQATSVKHISGRKIQKSDIVCYAGILPYRGLLTLEASALS